MTAGERIKKVSETGRYGRKGVRARTLHKLFALLAILEGFRIVFIDRELVSIILILRRRC